MPSPIGAASVTGLLSSVAVIPRVGASVLRVRVNVVSAFPTLLSSAVAALAGIVMIISPSESGVTVNV